MDNKFILEIFNKRGMSNPEQGINIYHLLNQIIALNIEGDVVELGCHNGAIASIMGKILEENDSKKTLYLYDSFEGLPNKTNYDGKTRFEKGWCSTTKKEILEFFRELKLKKPIIIKGWFKDTLPNKLPKKISFAHLDGDFYSSIKESLEAIYPRLSKGSIVIIDDYFDKKTHPKIEKLLNKNKYSIKSGRKIKINNILPGVKSACDEFFKNKKENLIILIAGEERHAYFRKR